NLGPDQRSESQKRKLAAFFRKQGPDFKKQFDEIDGLRKKEPKFPTALVLQELPKPRETFVMLGGDFTRKGEKVGPGVPAVLPPRPPPPAPRGRGVGGGGRGPRPLPPPPSPRGGEGGQRQLNRLDLARWLVDRRNPLIGRVTMNRLWQHHFGKGL